MHRLALLNLLLLAVPPSSQLAAQTTHDHSATGLQGTGRVHFATRCKPAAQPVLEQGIALLHSFWYEASEQAFQEAASLDPSCPFAFWGEAMSHLHPLWTPPPPAEFLAGLTAARQAVRLSSAGSRERDYASAVQQFYQVFQRSGFGPGIFAWDSAMAEVQAHHPKDDEATIFHALSLIAAGQQDPTDTSYARQRKAAALLDPLISRYPEHPGLAHYLIHAFDSPALAPLARAAADEYASIAPDVPHALHMPSHIYTRLGLWPEALASNLKSADAGKRLEEREHWSGVWAQRLHAWDYLAYASLQMRQDSLPRTLSEAAGRITSVLPANDLVGDYALAAIPARFALERDDWAAAARLPLRPAPAWPAAEALTHFARAIGASRSGDTTLARHEIDTLGVIESSLRKAGGPGTYWSGQVSIQRSAAIGWLAAVEGDTATALRSSREAADLEDRTEKHPVTPGPLLPARELYADLLLFLHRPAEALANYRISEDRQPNRARTRRGMDMAMRVIPRE